jgi:hypothetical protein
MHRKRAGRVMHVDFCGVELQLYAGKLEDAIPFWVRLFRRAVAGIDVSNLGSTS